MKQLMDFVRKNAVMGLAAGFALGSALFNLVAYFTTGIIEPLLARLFSTPSISEQVSIMGEGEDAVLISWGRPLMWLIIFLMTAMFVWLGVYLMDRSKKK